jgi:hypothetical protein
LNDKREEPESPTGDEERVRDAKRAVDRDNLILGRELYIAFSTGKYKTDGFTSFDDYAISIGVEKWKAGRLRRVFKKFSKDLGVSFDRMLEIGHERLKAIMPVIDRGSKEVWLNRAATMSYPDLCREVGKHKPIRKRRKQVDQSAGSQKTIYYPEDAAVLVKEIKDDRLKPSTDGSAVSADDTVYVKKLYLIGSQNTVFETAIDNMERRTGSDKVGYLLTSALEEFLAHEATRGLKDDKRMSYFMRILERRYKGKLLWVKNRKIAAELERLLKQAEKNVQEEEEDASE